MPDIILQSTPPLDLAISAWLSAKHGRTGSQKTLRAYSDSLYSFRNALHMVGIDLDSPAPLVASVAQAWASAGNPTATTHNQRLGILSSFYQFAIKRSYLAGGNPINNVDRRPVQEYAGATFIAADEVGKALAAIDRTTLEGKRDYALLALGFSTGRRLSEITNLRYDDLTFRPDGRIHVNFRRTKGGKTISDILPTGLSRALTDYLRETDPSEGSPVWVSLSNRSRGQALTARAVSDICEKRLGVSKVHALRHSFAHAMLEAGADVNQIKNRLGHSSLATTTRYLSGLVQAENEQGERLGQMFGIE